MELNNSTAELSNSFLFNGSSPISNYSLNDFFYKEYAFSTTDEYVIHLNSKNEIGLYFIFCWKGNIEIGLHDDKIKDISDFQSAVVYDSNLEGVNLVFKNNKCYRFCIIGFNHKFRNTNFSFLKFKNAFFSKASFNIPVFIGRPYLNLITSIEKLSRKVKEKIVSELILEGLIYQILGLKVEYYIESLNNGSKENSLLSTEELNRIKLITEEIKLNPSYEYSIEYLCRKSALSPLKLQEGFKEIYECTAMEYVRDERLEKAVKLLKTTDLNISEIVYSIGLTSRSYFSKIFKNKYKCSPRNFREK